MASLSSLSNVISGMRAAQVGLSVTGHNISNSTVIGYTRQQAIQQDFSYRNLGNSATGSLKMQGGLGTSVSQIRQIRNKFYDATYREENSSANYYSKKYQAGSEVNNIIGEMQSEYKAQDAINGVWVSVNELIKDPGAIETRTMFIKSCATFVDKMQDISRNLYEYQLNQNAQIKGEVDSINSAVSKIKDLNMQIEEIEADGSRANDLRDARNVLLDELSGFLDIEVKETPLPNSHSTRMDILINGQELLVNNVQQEIGLKFASEDYPFYEPVFTSSKEILPADSNATKLFHNLDKEDLGTNSSGTKGSLKGLLVARGDIIGNYSMSDDEIGNFLIPSIQKDIDTLVNTVVNMLNSAVMDNGTTDLNGNAGIPIFVRKSGDAYGVPEDPNDYGSLYTIENIEINPELLEADGYNKLAFSQSGDIGDTTILLKLSEDWKKPIDSLGGSSIDDYYKKMITDFAVKVQEDREKLEGKIETIDLAENNRMALSGVSLDEELSNMLKYQHAYNSAAKMVNVLDGMMDKIVNGTGRVGI